MGEHVVEYAGRERSVHKITFAECSQVNFSLLNFSSVLNFSFHYVVENHIELVGGKAFDVLGTAIDTSRMLAKTAGWTLA